MTDEELIEPYSVPEVFVDGFAKHVSHDGVMTCVGYRRMSDGNVVVLRLVWPVVNTAAAIDGAIEALSSPIHVAERGNAGSKRGAH